MNTTTINAAQATKGTKYLNQRGKPVTAKGPSADAGYVLLENAQGAIFDAPDNYQLTTMPEADPVLEGLLALHGDSLVVELKKLTDDQLDTLSDMVDDLEAMKAIQVEFIRRDTDTDTDTDTDEQPDPAPARDELQAAANANTEIDEAPDSALDLAGVKAGQHVLLGWFTRQEDGSWEEQERHQAEVDVTSARELQAWYQDEDGGDWRAAIDIRTGLETGKSRAATTERIEILALVDAEGATEQAGAAAETPPEPATPPIGNGEELIARDAYDRLTRDERVAGLHDSVRRSRTSLKLETDVDVLNDAIKAEHQRTKGKGPRETIIKQLTARAVALDGIAWTPPDTPAEPTAQPEDLPPEPGDAGQGDAAPAPDEPAAAATPAAETSDQADLKLPADQPDPMIHMSPHWRAGYEDGHEGRDEAPGARRGKAGKEYQEGWTDGTAKRREILRDRAVAEEVADEAGYDAGLAGRSPNPPAAGDEVRAAYGLGWARGRDDLEERITDLGYKHGSTGEEASPEGDDSLVVYYNIGWNRGRADWSKAQTETADAQAQTDAETKALEQMVDATAEALTRLAAFVDTLPLYREMGLKVSITITND